MKKPKAKEEPRVIDKDAPPCKGCWNEANFEFKGCAKSCNKMFEHLKKIFSKDCSPCLELRCGIPGANKAHAGICLNCRVREAYDARMGNGVKSPMGRSFTPYVTEWDIKHGVKYQH